MCEEDFADLSFISLQCDLWNADFPTVHKVSNNRVKKRYIHACNLVFT